MSAAVAFVLTIATIVTFLIQKYVLDTFSLGYLQTITFILVIAALVQMVEIVLKKVSPSLYQALGVFLPLITTNCCILGCGYPCYPERLRFADGSGLCVLHGTWFRLGADTVCRLARADEPG